MGNSQSAEIHNKSGRTIELIITTNKILSKETESCVHIEILNCCGPICMCRDSTTSKVTIAPGQEYHVPVEDNWTVYATVNVILKEDHQPSIASCVRCGNMEDSDWEGENTARACEDMILEAGNDVIVAYDEDEGVASVSSD